MSPKKNTVYINLEQPYFDQIVNGTKKEEYRTNGRYWYVRIIKRIRELRYIYFRNGYHTESKAMIIRLRGVVITKSTYILKLGSIVTIDPHKVSTLYK